MNQIQQIIVALKAFELFRKEVQPVLHACVTDKAFPLDERFQVWSSYCDKENRNWIIDRGDFGIVGDMVHDNLDDFARGCMYTWEDFIDTVEDDTRLTKEDFKEMLIETNFGSFVMDW